MSDNENTPKPGFRKDGKPLKEGNTREDGSFFIGKNRPDPKTQFQKDDGRERGRRPKGTKNLLTEWREELAEKIVMTEGGKPKKVTKRRALIKTKIDRGLKRSDRANEEALRYAELCEKRDPGVQEDDLKIIEVWLAGVQQTRDSDDFDDPSALTREGEDDTDLPKGESDG
ncbi:DUF5681 domain-containing protein [Sphingomonas sp. RS2018]